MPDTFCYEGKALLQKQPLNRITLGQHNHETNNRMKTFNAGSCVLF